MSRYEISVDGNIYQVEILHDDGSRAVLKVNGREYEVEIKNASAGVSARDATVMEPVPDVSEPAEPPRAAPASVEEQNAELETSESAEYCVRAPMPGVVLEVMVSVGQRVKQGDVVVRIEAMKMENDIKSELDGTVKEIPVTKGDEVQEGDALVVLEV